VDLEVFFFFFFFFSASTGSVDFLDFLVPTDVDAEASANSLFFF
jgi:hypothetical protein